MVNPVTSFRSAIFLFLLGIFISLIAVEIGLRVAGYIYELKYPLPKDRGANYRIFCVGESTTFGIGAKDPSQHNYPHQLEGLLNNSYPELKSQCFFDTTIGLNTSQMLINFPASLERYKPDLVILMVGINNWWNLNKSNVLLFNKNDQVQGFSLRALGFLDQFRVFKLLKWVCYSNKLIKFDSDFSIESSDRFDRATMGPDDARKINEAASRAFRLVSQRYGLDAMDKVAEYDMRQMIKICQSKKIRVIMSSYPQEPPTDLTVIQRNLAMEFGIPFVDNIALFNKLPGRETYFSNDSVHPNQKGYRLIAENIFSTIVKYKMIDGIHTSH